MILCKVSGNDQSLLRYLRLKLVELKDKHYANDEEFNTGVVDAADEKSYILTSLVKIHLDAGKRYLIMIEGTTPYVCADGSFDFNILYRDPVFDIQNVELIDPLEYMDRYAPTKYGIIFRERLFVSVCVREISGKGNGREVGGIYNIYVCK